EVTGPAMRKFMRDQGSEGAVSGKDRRCGKREPWILHSSERKTRRQYEHVVTIPLIRPVKFFRRRDHLLKVRELPRRLFNDTGFSIHASPFADWMECEITNCESEQIRGDRLSHLETITTTRVLRGRIRRAH